MNRSEREGISGGEGFLTRYRRTQNPKKGCTPDEGGGAHSPNRLPHLTPHSPVPRLLRIEVAFSQMRLQTQSSLDKPMQLFFGF